MTVDLVLQSRRIVTVHDSPRTLTLDLKRTERNTHMAHLAPVLCQTIAHDHMLVLARINAPTNNRDDVVNGTSSLGKGS